MAIACCRGSFVPLITTKTNHLFKGEKKREEGKGGIWKGGVEICSYSFPEAELFISLSSFDKSEFYNKIFPNRALSVEVSYRWEENDAVLWKTETMSPCSQSRLFSPHIYLLHKTPSSAFHLRTSKPSKVIKIAPAWELRGPAALAQNGMWENRLSKCANSICHVFTACIFNQLKKPHIAINWHYLLWHQKTQLDSRI